MNRIGEIIGVFIIAALMIVLIPTMFVVIAVIFLVVALVFVVAILTGVPIQVKQDGEVIGEIRYFKFHRNAKSGKEHE